MKKKMMKAKWGDGEGKWGRERKGKHNNNESRETLEYIKRIPYWPASFCSCS
jgi:hypothetical protein